MPYQWNLGRPEDVSKALNIPRSTSDIHYPRPDTSSAASLHNEPSLSPQNSRAARPESAAALSRASSLIARPKGSASHHLRAKEAREFEPSPDLPMVKLNTPSQLWQQQVLLNMRAGRSKRASALAAAKPQYSADPRIADPRRLAMRRDLSRNDNLLQYPLRGRMWNERGERTNKQIHVEWRGTGF